MLKISLYLLSLIYDFHQLIHGQMFLKPVVVDNKNDINNINKTLTNVDLIEQFTKQRKDSKWKLYRFLDVKFHVYEMNTPIGKSNELIFILKQIQF
jgi:hypothetical protein